MIGNRHGTLHLLPMRRPLLHREILWLFAPCGVTLRNPSTGAIHATRGELLTLASEEELDALLADPAGMCLQLWWPDGSDLMTTLSQDPERWVVSYVYQSAGEARDAFMPPLWERAFYRYAAEDAALAMICDASGDAQEVDWDHWLRQPMSLPPPYPDLMIVPNDVATIFGLDRRSVRCEAIASRWVRAERQTS